MEQEWPQRTGDRNLGASFRIYYSKRFPFEGTHVLVSCHVLVPLSAVHNVYQLCRTPRGKGKASVPILTNRLGAHMVHEVLL